MIYTPQESSLLFYLNTHYFIKNLRDQETDMGPRVI